MHLVANEGRSRGIDVESRTWLQRACINVDHMAEDRWEAPLVDAVGHAFCQATYNGIEGSDWVKLYEPLQRNELGSGSKEAKCKK